MEHTQSQTHTKYYLLISSSSSFNFHIIHNNYTPPYHILHNTLYTLIHRLQHNWSVLPKYPTSTINTSMPPTQVHRSLRTSSNSMRLPSINYWQLEHLPLRIYNTNCGIHWRKLKKLKNQLPLSLPIPRPKQFHQQLSSTKEPLNQPHGIIGTL